MPKRISPVRLVVVFDNMPKLWSCATGCRTNPNHLCEHRFPRGVRVIAHTKHLDRPGLSDLNVSRHAFKMMGWGLSGVSAGTRWVLFTADGGFWKSAKHQYRALNGHAPKPVLRFEERSGTNRGRILARLPDREASLEIFYLPYSKHKGTQRDSHLRKTVRLAERLLAEGGRTS